MCRMNNEYTPITKARAIELLGSSRKIATALGLSRRAVELWPLDEPLDIRTSLAIEMVAEHLVLPDDTSTKHSAT